LVCPELGQGLRRAHLKSGTFQGHLLAAALTWAGVASCPENYLDESGAVCVLVDD